MSVYASVAAVREACAICGKATKSRCSGCLDAGGPSIFFCSPEHQRLVWHNHKSVCRNKSASFIVPPLSDEEFERFEHFARRKALVGPGSQVGKTFAEAFEDDPRFGLRKGELRSRIIPSLTSTDRLEDATKQVWLTRARGIAASNYSSERVQGQPDVRVHTVWEIVAWITTTTWFLFPESAKSEQNFNLVKHHALICATLLQLKASPSTKTFDKEWIRASFQHLTSAIADTIPTRDVDKFQKLLNTLAAPISQVEGGLRAAAVLVPL